MKKNRNCDSDCYCWLPTRISSRMQDNLLLLMFMAVMAILAGLV